MVNHSFLFKEAIWSIKGIFNCSENKDTPCEGMLKITHKPHVWLNEGMLKILADIAWEHYNFYEIVPIEPGKDITTFKSMSPIMGNINGRLMIVDNAILTNFTSENGTFSGIEMILKNDEENYTGYGYILMGESKIGSWTLNLHMV